MKVLEINGVRCLVGSGEETAIDAIQQRISAVAWQNANRYGEAWLLNADSTDAMKRRLAIVKALGLSLVYRAKGGQGAIWRGQGFPTVFNSPAGARAHIHGLEAAQKVAEREDRRLAAIAAAHSA